MVEKKTEAEASAFNREFHRRFGEEKPPPPNKRPGMRGDVRSIRVFNQEGRPRFFSFAGERRETRASCWPVRHSDIAA